MNHSGQTPNLARLASGRRVVNLCLFATLGTAPFHVLDAPLGRLAFVLVSTTAAVIGTTRISRGFGFSGSKTGLLAIGSAIPLLGWLTMAWLGLRASKALQAAGYQVGMFKSRPPDLSRLR